MNTSIASLCVSVVLTVLTVQASAEDLPKPFSCRLELLQDTVLAETGRCHFIIRVQRNDLDDLRDRLLVNPCLDPTQSPVGEVIVTNAMGEELGNLLTTLASRKEGFYDLPHQDRTILPFSGSLLAAIPVNTYFGRVVHTAPIVTQRDGVKVALDPGTYRLKAVFYGDLQKFWPKRHMDQDLLHARVICESEVAALRVVSTEELLGKNPPPTPQLNEFHIAQIDSDLFIEYRNISNEIREVSAFGAKPVLSRSPGFVRMTSDNGVVYDVPTYNPMQLALGLSCQIGGTPLSFLHRALSVFVCRVREHTIFPSANTRISSSWRLAASSLLTSSLIQRIHSSPFPTTKFTGHRIRSSMIRC